MLDGKEVNEATRLFLQSWQANKEMKRAKRKQDSPEDSNRIHGLDPLPNISLSQTHAPDAAYALHPVGPFTKQNRRFTSMMIKTTEKKEIPGELSIR